MQITAVSYLALLLSLLALPVASVRLTLPKLTFSIFLLVYHIGTTILAYSYAQNHIADSALYYYDYWHFAGKPWWSLSTVFVIHLTLFLKDFLGASYLDCFLIYQTIGFWGIMILMRIFEEIHQKLLMPDSTFSKYLLCLPTIQYWTSAIGKDSILFFAMALCMWSALRFSNRSIRFCIAIFVMVLVRAHIAVVVVASLVIAATFYRGFRLGRRVALLIPAIGALVGLGVVVQSSIGINLSDAGSIATFLEERTVVVAGAAGNTSLTGDSFFVRLVSLLFRPMFYDARNFLGIIASVENLLLLSLFIYGIIRWREVVELYRKIFFIRFALVVTLALILLLALVNYNVGLGLRQRAMFLPPLLSILVAVWAYRERIKMGERPATAASAPNPQMAVPAVAGTLNRSPRA